MEKILAVFGLVTLLSFGAQRLIATSIVVFWTPFGGIIGADSKIKTVDSRERPRFCKVGGYSGQFIWAETGILSVEHSGLDYMSLVADGLSRPGSFRSKVTTVDSYVTDTLNAIIDKTKDPRRFIKKLEASHMKFELAIVIISIANNKSELAVRDYRLEVLPSHKVGIKTDGMICPGAKKCSGDMAVFGMGFHEVIDAEIANNPEIPKMDPVAAINYMIGKEIEAHPEYVGTPISVVRLDRSGVKWLSPGACKKDQE